MNDPRESQGDPNRTWGDQREQLRRQLDHATAAFRLHAREGLLYVDTEGRVISWNPQAVLLLGLDREPVSGLPLQDLLPSEPWARNLLLAVRQRRAGEWGAPRPRPQGGPRHLMAALVPFEENGSPLGSLITLWEIDLPETSEVIAQLTRQYGELKNAHEELRRIHERLAHPDATPSSLPTRLLTNGLQDLTRQLGALNQLIQDKTQSPESDELLKGILQCRGTVSKLGSLLAPPPLTLSVHPLNHVLDRVVAMADERLKPKGLHCDKRYPAGLPPVEVDLPALTEAVLHLVTAYSESLPSGARLFFQAEVQEDVQQVLVCVVSSIPAAQPAFLLEEVPAWGLFGAHHLLEAHHIAVEVERPDDHPRLTLRMPFQRGTPPSERATPATLLLVEERREAVAPLIKFLGQEGYEVPVVSDGRAALKRIEEEPPDILLVSEALLDREGLGWIAELKRADPLLPVAVLADHEPGPAAARALNAGAFQVLGRPFRKEEVLGCVQKGLELRRVKLELDLLRQQVVSPSEGGLVLGESPEMNQVLTLIQQVAPTDMTVILQGESGSGKEVAARLIHRHSRRAAKPFIAIDCGALPESLVESELFGYERGAFTGADRRKLGHFELAQGGTLFFDEIGNLGAPVQAKLLRVLQERSIQRLGGRRAIPVDVRVITASNVDLASAVKAGQFREDLYHRLNEFTVTVPALRNRPQDIPILAEAFRQEANQELGKRVTGFDPEVFAMLKSYPWPGNIRELKNTIKRSILLADQVVLPEHLEVTLRLRQPLKPTGSSAGPAAPSSLLPTGGPASELKRASKRAASEVEKQLIQDALEKTRFNKTEAAKLLGIDRTALYYKMKKYGMNL